MLAVIVAVTLAAAGCGGARTGCPMSTRDGVRTGPVTVLRADVLCVGGPQATGTCFSTSAEQTRGLRVSVCVTVHYDTTDVGGRRRASSVEQVSRQSSR